ncbi:Tetratricopeptide repeat protein [Crateriforma conspicua]|uniref:Tetratricopeptide repeat protein n=1 Tax=Crateriforma conspicua TaxID=2527996 RepID=A0A5C6FNU1_9PLAN|nr:hypothetical protein [Crateriforma conspicua]TWU62328.1 Tetratricopeptide repeat protein [Crateriforma conspicua]
MPINSRFRAFRLSLVLLAMAICVGCGTLSKQSGTDATYATASPADTKADAKASQLNRRGLKHFQKQEFDLAEKMFREALEVNVSFAPAHNNLGQVYIARHQLYLAAWEFEYAANLMPERVEPIINQGLAYEMAGRIERAEDYYRRAHDREPTHPWAISSLVRTLIKQNEDPDEIRFLLRELILHDHREDWVQWAELLMETRFGVDCDQCTDYQSFPRGGLEPTPYSLPSKESPSGSTMGDVEDVQLFDPNMSLPSDEPATPFNEGTGSDIELREESISLPVRIDRIPPLLDQRSLGENLPSRLPSVKPRSLPSTGIDPNREVTPASWLEAIPQRHDANGASNQAVQPTRGPKKGQDLGAQRQ